MNTIASTGGKSNMNVINVVALDFLPRIPRNLY